MLLKFLIAKDRLHDILRSLASAMAYKPTLTSRILPWNDCILMRIKLVCLSSQVITHELHKASLSSILQFNAFSPDWDSAVHLKDIVDFLSIANSFASTGKVQPTLISNDSRVAILAVATNLQHMQASQSAEGSVSNGKKKENLNAVVLGLLGSDSDAVSQPLYLTFSMAKELCLKFLITQLLNIVSSTPIGCETFADKLLKLFLTLKDRFVPIHSYYRHFTHISYTLSTHHSAPHFPSCSPSDIVLSPPQCIPTSP